MADLHSALTQKLCLLPIHTLHNHEIAEFLLFFCTTLCTCSPGDSITGYETLGSPLMTQERSLRSDVTATSRTNSFNETAALRARARASYTLRSALRSSRTRVIWFGKSRTIVDLRRTHRHSCLLDLYQRIVCYCLPPSTSSQYKHSNLHNSTIPSDSLPYWGLLKNHSRGYNYTSKTIVLHLLMTPSSHTCPARGLEFACSVHKQTSSER